MCDSILKCTFDDPTSEIEQVVEWYFKTIYGVHEGPGILPYYSDPKKVGGFAVSMDELATGNEEAFFRLFVTLSMFQGLRDVVIMKRQRSLEREAVEVLTSPDHIMKAAERNDCRRLRTDVEFDVGCDVGKMESTVDCRSHPGRRCHVKAASIAFNRMGDMGKLSTSAWLHFWRDKGLSALLSEELKIEKSSAKRAVHLVEKFSHVYRFGRKLSTMFVSALCTPALAPGYSPWFPEIDGNELVVVDTNVNQAIDTLSNIKL